MWTMTMKSLARRGETARCPRKAGSEESLEEIVLQLCAQPPQPFERCGEMVERRASSSFLLDLLPSPVDCQ